MEPPIDRNKYHLLKDLPRTMQWAYIHNMKKILQLHDKFEKNSALQSYFQRNSLCQLEKITKKNNDKIKRKLNKLIDFNISECERKLKSHRKCITVLKDSLRDYRVCDLKLKR